MVSCRIGRRSLIRASGAAFLFPQALFAAPHTYRLLPQASHVRFTFLLAGLPQRGRMPIRDARIRIDLADLRRSQVDIRLDATGASTGLAAATEALRGPAILNSVRFPDIRYRARHFQPGPGTATEMTARILGDLTLRQSTRPLTLHAILRAPVGSAPRNMATLAGLDVSLRGQISRAAFGADGYRELVADPVSLTILARLRRID